jgi:hypothetical protein
MKQTQFSLRRNSEKEVCTELCNREVRTETAWWKTGVWRLKGSGETMNRGSTLYIGKRKIGATYSGMKKQGHDNTGART